MAEESDELNLSSEEVRHQFFDAMADVAEHDPDMYAIWMDVRYRNRKKNLFRENQSIFFFSCYVFMDGEMSSLLAFPMKISQFLQTMRKKSVAF